MKLREMKDSGIDIVKDIPQEWSLIRLKYLCSIQTGNQDTQDADENGQYNFYVRSPIIEKSSHYTFDGEGILMAGDGAGAGRIFHHAFGKYAVHQRVYRLSQFHNINSYYLFYYLSNLFNVEMDKGSAQSTVPSVRLPMLLNFAVCIPSKEEQDKIAVFLDHKCSEIDSLTADIQNQIEVLEEYKRSVITEAVSRGLSLNADTEATAISWIKYKPKKWMLSKIKYEIIPLSRPVKSTDEVITCFRDGQVTLRKYRREEGFTISFTENGYHGVEEGDLVIHGMDTFAGAIGCSECRGKCTPVVHVCGTTGNNRYFMYYLRSLANNGVLWFYANGVRVRSSDFRNFANLGKFSIAVPPISEQNEIVGYLDKKCSEIDCIIADKKRQIETIEEYKRSLIFEYVTGKKEV